MSDLKKPPFLRHAREASLSEGMRRLSGIALDIRAGAQLSDQDRDFLATALEAIIEGKDPATSPETGERKGPGRPRKKPATTPFNSDLLLRVDVAAEVAYQQFANRISEDAARELISAGRDGFRRSDRHGPKTGKVGSISVPLGLSFEETQNYLVELTKNGNFPTYEPRKYIFGKNTLKQYRLEAFHHGLGPYLIYRTFLNKIQEDSQELEVFLCGFLNSFRDHPEIIERFALEVVQSGKYIAKFFSWDEQIEEEDRPRRVLDMLLLVLLDDFPALLDEVLPIVLGRVKRTKSGQ